MVLQESAFGIIEEPDVHLIELKGEVIKDAFLQLENTPNAIKENLLMVKVGVKTKVLVEKGWRDMLLERMSVGVLENHLEQLAGRMFVMPKKK